MRYIFHLEIWLVIILKLSSLHAQERLKGEYIANIGALYIDSTNIDLIERVEIATGFKTLLNTIDLQDSFMISFSPQSTSNRLLIKKDIIENLEKNFRIKFIVYFYDGRRNLKNKVDSLFSKFQIEGPEFANLTVINTIKTEQIKIINNSINIRYIQFGQIKFIKSSSSKTELIIKDSDTNFLPSQAQEIIFTIPIKNQVETINEIAIDDVPVLDLQIDLGPGKLLFRGDQSMVDKLSNGIHTITVYLNNKREEFIFWKELKELKQFQKEYFGNCYALIIGISRYGKGFRDLPEVESQAKELGKLLAKNHFQVTYLLDTEQKITLKTVNDAIKMLNRKMDPNKDKLFFYYGGHGKAIKPAFGDSIAYLILNDYDINDLENTCLSMDEIFGGKYLRWINAKHVLYAIDACVASIGRRLGRPSEKETRQFVDLNLLYSLTKEPGRTIFTAGSGAQEAINEKGKGGIFTKALIKALSGDADQFYGDGNGATIMNELESCLTAYVTSEARLKRWPQQPARFDFGNGQFVFIHYPESGK